VKTVVVGDVHGCLRELDELLRVVQFSPHDTLISVGDLVNKGPDSIGVLRRFRELNGLLVRGNHEVRHLQILKGKELDRAAQPAEQAVQRQLNEQDVQFLRGSVLHHRLPEFGAVVVHGGIPRELESLEGRKSSQQLKLYQRLPLLKQQDGVFWAWGYDGRFGHCYFGHQPFMQDGPAHYPHATGLDLGCCAGGHLCAVVLEVGMSPSFVTVKSKESA